MARNSDYGFVSNDTYWNIGTEDLRGKDGDDARVAARKYNDHRHSAVDLGTNTQAFYGFLNENVPLINEGGLDYGISDPTTVAPLRRSGDIVRFKDLLWVYSSEYNRAIPLGVGPGCYFEEDHNTNDGTFVREAITSQELVCGREEITHNLLPSFDENGVTIEYLTASKEIGGILLDMGMHSLHRARPMVRFECTGVVVHEGSDPFENLEADNNVEEYSNTTLGKILSEFLTFSAAKSGEVEFVWDRSGEVAGPASREDKFIGEQGDIAPLYINDSSMGAVVTQRSPFVLLDLDKNYTIRVRARLRTFNTNQEIVDEWNRFSTAVQAGTVPNLPNINFLPSLNDVVLFGGIEQGTRVNGQGVTLYDKIRYWQSSHCTFELLNVKIRIDNFLGLYPADNGAGVRQTALTLPDDISSTFN